MKQILSEIPWIEKDSISDTATIHSNDSVKWSGISKAGDYSGRIFFDENNIVTLIRITPIDEILTFEEIVNKLGEPESVLVIYDGGLKPIMSIDVFYPSKGYAFMDYYDADEREYGEKGKIFPDEYVQGVSYFEPEYFYKYVTERQIAGYTLESLQNNLQKWKGFGQYDVDRVGNIPQ